MLCPGIKKNNAISSKKKLSDKKINHTKFEPIKSINTILYGEMLITMLIFEPKETSKINDFRGLLNFGGPYGTIYKPFFTGFEETRN